MKNKLKWKVGDILSHERAGNRKIIATSPVGIYHFSMSDDFEQYGFCMTRKGMEDYGYYKRDNQYIK